MESPVAAWDVIDKLNDEFSELQKEKDQIEGYFVKQIKRMNYDLCLKYIYKSARLIQDRCDDYILEYEEDHAGAFMAPESDWNSVEEINEQCGFSPKNFIEEIKSWNDEGWTELDVFVINDELN
tara:strand:+ start:1038 stop:1409 length:372 start_codon:yes stop_codon:yes gene_type:complete